MQQKKQNMNDSRTIKIFETLPKFFTDTGVTNPTRLCVLGNLNLDSSNDSEIEKNHELFYKNYNQFIKDFNRQQTLIEENGASRFIDINSQDMKKFQSDQHKEFDKMFKEARKSQNVKNNQRSQKIKIKIDNQFILDKIELLRNVLNLPTNVSNQAIYNLVQLYHQGIFFPLVESLSLDYNNDNKYISDILFPISFSDKFGKMVINKDGSATLVLCLLYKVKIQKSESYGLDYAIIKMALPLDFKDPKAAKATISFIPLQHMVEKMPGGNENIKELVHIWHKGQQRLMESGFVQKNNRQISDQEALKDLIDICKLNTITADENCQANFPGDTESKKKDFYPAFIAKYVQDEQKFQERDVVAKYAQAQAMRLQVEKNKLTISKIQLTSTISSMGLIASVIPMVFVGCYAPILFISVAIFSLGVVSSIAARCYVNKKHSQSQNILNMSQNAQEIGY